MPDIQHSRELRERRAELGQQLASIVKGAHEEDRSLNADERQQTDRINADMDMLKVRITDMELVETVERDLDAPAKTPAGPETFRLDDGRIADRMPADKDKVITNRDEDLAFRAASLRQHATEEMRQAADKCQVPIPVGTGEWETKLRMLDSRRYSELRKRFRDDDLVYRATTAQSKGTTTLGGHTVPVDLLARVEVALLYFGGMRESATILRTDAGEDLRLPTADDTDAFSTVKTENSAATVSDIAFGLVTLRAATFNSGIVRASMELVQDTAIDLAAFVGDQLGTRHGRGMNREFTTGSTATTTPRGIIRDSAAGYTATTATGGNIGLQSLVRTLHSVDREYRNAAGAGWLMHDGIVKEARLVVDSNGLPLWGAGLRAGEPDMLLGKPVFVNNRLTASSTVTGSPALAYFGDLSRYWIRDVTGSTLVTFQERYMDAFQIAWVHFMRSDGALLVASTRTASKPVKHLVSLTT